MAQRPPEDYGFSTAGGKGSRLINQDGSFNVVRRGLPFYESFSIYHSLINMSWPAFYALVLGLFLLVNALFALVYVYLGVENIHVLPGATLFPPFPEAFFFSAQTITAGFGHAFAEGVGTTIVASLESMFGLLGFAIVAGLHFARFARPQAKILFSRQALIAPYLDGKALMFRIVNARSHPLVEIQVEVGLAWVQGSAETSRRQFQSLPLERNSINFFPLTWTLVHPIDAQSPLYGVSVEELRGWDAELFIVVKAFDDSFNESVRVRFSYKPDEIVWGAKFVPAFSRAENGTTYVDLHRISDYAPAELPASLPVRETPGG